MAALTPMIGRVLRETYRVVRPIRTGGMGQLFEAENVRLPELRYAIKLLRERINPTSPRFAHFYARFRREAEIIAGLRHPNIVQLLDFDTTSDGTAFLVMEFLEGEDLRDRLRREQRLAADEARPVIEQLGSALQLAHDRGVIHRDLKPSNVFLERIPGGLPRVRLLDFGLSKKVLASSEPLTAASAVLGTASYMSPEQASGETVTFATDIFSLATLAYRCLTGRHPFSGGDERSIRASVCHDQPPPATALVPDLPPAVDNILGRAHSKRPEERYPRIIEFALELCTALSDVTAARPAPAPQGERLPTPEPSVTEEDTERRGKARVASADGRDSGATKEFQGSARLRLKLFSGLALLSALAFGGALAAWRWLPHRSGGANKQATLDARLRAPDSSMSQRDIRLEHETAIKASAHAVRRARAPAEPNGAKPTGRQQPTTTPRRPAPASQSSPKPRPRRTPFDRGRLRYNEI